MSDSKFERESRRTGQYAQLQILMDPALMDLSEEVRKEATIELGRDERAQLGQFFTPATVALFMAERFEGSHQEVRLLDPGAGTGSLSAAATEVLLRKQPRLRRLHVTACEMDSALINSLRRVLAEGRAIAEARGVEFSAEVVAMDFLELAADRLGSKESVPFTHAILNPPYGKIGARSRERRLCHELGFDAPNMYAAFLGAAVQLLEEDGQVVSITPRSFCNGTYFRRFRKYLLAEVDLRRLHVFDSRRDAFREDKVLQENVILHGVRTSARTDMVHVSMSEGPGGQIKSRLVSRNEVVFPGDKEQFVHLVVDDRGARALRWVARMPSALADLGVAVSTGPVVAFRTQEALRAEPTADSVPLLYPAHLSKGTISWPLPNGRKPNAIQLTPSTKRLLVPAETYVLIRRFSSKEEPRRLVAGLCEGWQLGSDWLGIENHLNFLHADGSGLPPELARGLTIYLSTTTVDTYFRLFSGHTQVNAGDLRSLRYPDRCALLLMGKEWPEGGEVSVEVADRIVEDVLGAAAVHSA